jgi:oligoribonuclease NrnB/cAMP/cGMP phosphodiesterase (DHH superfamily)
MKCFYHSADLDGHCSGAIVKYFNPECELIPINYGQDFPWDKISPKEKVFMVDFSLQPFTNMERLATLADLIWIDHHQTAIDDYEKAELRQNGLPIAGVQRNGTGACELTWEYFSKDPWPFAVQLLAEYDVWNHTDERTLPFQYGLRMQNTDPRTGEAMALWKILFCKEEIVKALINAGKTILAYEAQTDAKFCKAYAFETIMPAYSMNLAGPAPADVPPILRAICVNKGFTNSKVFDSVYVPAKHDLMITFCRLPLPKKQWTISLYSDKSEVDCGAIAKSFGGGGHKGAAGFQCDDLPFEY